jgi:hypothetical protein
MLPQIFALTEDPVPAVRVAVKRALTRLRTIFQDVGDDQRHQDVLNAFMTMNHTMDQFTDEIWRECCDKMETTKSGLSSLPRLPSCGSSSSTRLTGDPQRRPNSFLSLTQSTSVSDTPPSSLQNQRPRLSGTRGMKHQRVRAAPMRPKMRTFAVSDFKPAQGGSGDE